jgi:hypothetical protein
MKTEARINRCPACGRRIDPWRAIIGNEKTAFRCKGCEVRLVKKGARASLGAAAFVGWFGVRMRYGWDGWQTWAAFLGISIVLVVIAATSTRVRLATADDPDPLPKQKIPDGPPPLDPVFRGMSGPPPEARKRSSGD